MVTAEFLIEKKAPIFYRGVLFVLNRKGSNEGEPKKTEIDLFVSSYTLN